MQKVSQWFWRLGFVFLFCQLGAAGTILSAPVSEKGGKPDVEENSEDRGRKLSGRIADFFLSSKTDEQDIPTTDTVTVISSRLPGFRARLSDIPSNISYIPANVSYKSKNELSEQQPHFFQEALRDTEGALFYDQVGNGLDTTFGLRGFTEGGSAVITLVDGVRVNETDGGDVNFPLIPMSDVEYIQIDRGSVSPIYGSGAFGGVMNIITRRPSSKPFNAFGSLELSSFLGIRFNQGVSGSIRDRWSPLGGKFVYYFNGGRDLNDGFRDNGEWRITSFDIKAGYEFPEDEGRFMVGVKHVDDALSNPGALTLDEFHADQEQTKTDLAGRDFRATTIQMNADKKFWDDRIIASILASWRINLIHFFTTSRTFTDFFQPQFNPDTDRVTTKSRQRNLVWQIAYEDAWKWFGNKSEIGMEFQREVQTDLEQDFFQGALITTTAAETDRIAKARSAALFWRETVKFWERVIIYAGMRHDYHWIKVRDQVAAVNNFDKRWNDSTFSTGITIKPFSFSDLFFNYSQGFRVPNISDIASFPEFGGSGVSADLSPEKSDSYEAGTRLRYKDLAQYKFSYFLIDVKDEIVFDSNSATQQFPGGANINLGRSRRYGIENRVDLNPIEEVDFYGTYTWMKAYVRETDNDGSIIDGRSIGLVPANCFTVGTALKPFARLGSPYDGFAIAMNGSFTGKQHIQSYETASQGILNAGGRIIKPYSVWNFMASFKWKGKQIYFKINNLFNARYFSRAVTATSFGTANTPAGTFLFVNPGAPREYVLGATWEFD